MQVNSVKSITSFGERRNRFDDASRFVNMNNRQVAYLAYDKAVNPEEERKHQKTILGMLCAIPIVHSIVSGIAHTEWLSHIDTFQVEDVTVNVFKPKFEPILRESASEMVSVAAKTAKAWGLGLAGVFAYHAIKNKVVEKSKPLQEFNKEHPIASFGIDLGLILGGFGLLSAGLAHPKVQALKDSSVIFQSIGNFGKNISQRLNASKFGSKILPNIIESYKSAPAPVKLGALVLAHLPLIIAGATLIKDAAHNKKTKDNIRQEYYGLKEKQFQTAKNLYRQTKTERDFLVAIQEQEIAEQLGCSVPELRSKQEEIDQMFSQAGV
ncbi:MAG: hypothetical protein PHC64_04570 [Candidatus Gastranaerophilales bacterium]|nr:hypothetical protein [Candidatus Gastranaerophilales bacterium]